MTDLELNDRHLCARCTHPIEANAPLGATICGCCADELRDEADAQAAMQAAEAEEAERDAQLEAEYQAEMEATYGDDRP